MNSQVRDYYTAAQSESGIAFAYVIDTELQDWTSMPLTLNSEFSDFPVLPDPNKQIPQYWQLSHNMGPDLVVAPDLNSYVTPPSAVKFRYDGTGGNLRRVGIRQSIPIRNILQTKGIYRLIFSFLSNDDSIIFYPLLEFLNADGVMVTRQPFPSLEIDDSGGAWHIYDRRVTFNDVAEDVAFVRLEIAFKRFKDGAFQLNLDSVDFHYGFDMVRKPTFPSAIPPSLSTVFKRTIEGEGHILTTRGGSIKHIGAMQFGMVPKTQMERMKAVWAFMKGHRLNIKSVLPHRAGVTLPKELRFHWPGEFDWAPTWSLENTFNINVPLQEI